MVRLIILAFIKYSMVFKKRFEKKDYIDHILIGDFFVDLQYAPQADFWRLSIRNFKVNKWFVLSKQGTDKFKSEYVSFVGKVIHNDKSLLGFR